MSLLTDQEILESLHTQPPMVEDVHLPERRFGEPALNEHDQWFVKDSPIQPSSIDLHIGEIYLPDRDPEKPGGVDNPVKKFALRFGHTAVVKTREKLNLPNDVAGFGFPPARVAFGGLLMINPGHIDPGYSGYLHLTLINVGRADIVLDCNEAIFSLLLIRLGREVHRDYSQRRDSTDPGHQRFANQLDRLSPDFLDVETRTTAAAQKAVDKASIRTPIWTAVITGLLILCVKPLLDTYLASNSMDALIEKRVDVLETAVAISHPSSKIDEIDELMNRINSLELKLEKLQEDPIDEGN